MISKRERKGIAAKVDMLNAVKIALVKHGFVKLGINAVAEESSMDKSAIYRYFEDFEGLLAAYIEKQDYWFQSFEQYTAKEKLTKDLVKNFFKEQYDLLYNHPELQEIFRWELSDKSSLSTPIAVKREIYSEELLEKSQHLLDHCGINFNYLLSIFLGGIYYAILHKDKGSFFEVDISLKKHKEEFFKTMDWLIDLLFDSNATHSRNKTIAFNALKEGVSKVGIARILGISVEEVKALLKQPS